MNYIRFDFEIENAAQAEQLIALLAAQGFEGFEENGDSLDAFIAEHQFRPEEFSRAIDRFAAVTFTRTIIENINWNKKWEEEFKPVVIDDFVAIRAGFHPRLLGVAHELVITPKMSFGTGHHATTYLMISQMRHLDLRESCIGLRYRHRRFGHMGKKTGRCHGCCGGLR